MQPQFSGRGGSTIRWNFDRHTQLGANSTRRGVHGRDPPTAIAAILGRQRKCARRIHEAADAKPVPVTGTTAVDSAIVKKIGVSTVTFAIEWN
jgi:hypothetical protein